MSDVSDEALLRSVKSDSVEICLALAWEVVRRKGSRVRWTAAFRSQGPQESEASWFAGVADARFALRSPSVVEEGSCRQPGILRQ